MTRKILAIIYNKEKVHKKCARFETEIAIFDKYDLQNDFIIKIKKKLSAIILEVSG